MVHGATVRLSVGQLVAEGSDFAREAWRECWLSILLVTLGHALIFVGQHVPAAEWNPGPLGWIAPLLLIFYVPLYGGLYRAALGGRPAMSRGFGGLQWTVVEWRLIAVGIVIAFLTGLAMTPFSAITGVAAVVMRNGVFSTGPFGQWARWTPFAIVIWGVFFWIFAPRIGRLMLGWPFSVAREKTEPFGGFSLSKESGWALAFALVACFIPLLLGWVAFYAIGLVEADAVSGVYWPLPEAMGVGILLGGLKAGLVAPLVVGVLSGAYWLLEGDWLAEEEKPEHSAHHAGPAGLAEAAIAAAALTAEAATEDGVGHSSSDAADEKEDELEAAADEAATASADTADQAAIHAENTTALAEADAAEVQDSIANDDPAAHLHPMPADETHSAETHASTGLDSETIESSSETDHETATAVELEPGPIAPPSAVEPLSPWPHSVLPPWPTKLRGFEPAPSRAILTATASGPAEPLDLLASRVDPAHPLGGVTESS